MGFNELRTLLHGGENERFRGAFCARLCAFRCIAGGGVRAEVPGRETGCVDRILRAVRQGRVLDGEGGRSRDTQKHSTLSTHASTIVCGLFESNG
jgi:hypothetical protein